MPSMRTHVAHFVCPHPPPPQIQPSRYNNGNLYAVGNNTYYENGNRGRILESDLEVTGTDNIAHIIGAFLFTEEE